MAVADLGVGNTDYVAQCAEGCEKDVRHTWAVCEPRPGELLAQVTLKPASGNIGTPGSVC